MTDGKVVIASKQLSVQAKMSHIYKQRVRSLILLSLPVSMLAKQCAAAVAAASNIMNILFGKGEECSMGLLVVSSIGGILASLEVLSSAF